MKILSRFFVIKFKKATMNSRTLTENHPDRGLATNTYDKASNLISMNRASIGAIDFGYSYNRLTSRTMPGSSGNDLYDVVYTYGTLGDGKNGAGRIVTIDQGQGFKVDHYSYDELGQRVVEQSTIQVPQVGQRTYQTEFKYSSFGRILQASYPDGDVVNYHYTDKGELFSIESTAPGEPKLFVVQETQYNGFGQIGTLIYGNGTKTTYNYASSDFVTSGLGHLNKTALFTSTVEGKATLSGATTALVSRDYEYSNLGMVNSLNKSIHSTLAAGITSLDYSFSYDDKGRLQGSTLATGGMNIYELTMGYNAVGGITSKDSDLPNGGHPLVNPNLKYDLSYSYNPAKPHQLLSVTEVGPNGGITNFSYDDVGNLTESFGPSGTEELIWNELQQLSGVMNGNGIHHYVYDHNGERIMKSSINRSWVQVNDQNVDDIQYLEPYTLYVNPYYVVTSFHNGDHISKHYYMNTQRVATDISINYQGPPPPIAPGPPMSNDSAQTTGIGISASFKDDLNEVLLQFDAGDLSSSLSENGVAMEKYYPNAASESESMNRILYWYHPDYLGSVDLVTDRNGVAYEFFLYTPWGEDMYNYNAGNSSFTSPYRFNGKEKDPETGYHYYGARYYQSKFSVWMSVDPLVKKTMESYSFSSNNPISLIDPDGNEPIKPPKNGTAENRIKTGRQFLGTPYQQETSIELRTGLTKSALEKMDCSEFVARILHDDGWTSTVKSLPTSNERMQNWLEDNWNETSSPRAGDILVWKGHVAMLTEDYTEGSKLNVIHATKYGKVSSVVEERYSMSYYEKKGARFFTPSLFVQTVNQNGQNEIVPFSPGMIKMPNGMYTYRFERSPLKDDKQINHSANGSIKQQPIELRPKEISL